MWVVSFILFWEKSLISYACVIFLSLLINHEEILFLDIDLAKIARHAQVHGYNV